MGRGLTHLISIKGLDSLSCIAIGSCTQVFLSSNDTFQMGFPAVTCFLTRERHSRTRHSVVRLHSKEMQSKQRCEEIIIATLSWSNLKLHAYVCMCSINEESVILCNIKTIKHSGFYPPVYSLSPLTSVQSTVIPKSGKI